MEITNVPYSLGISWHRWHVDVKSFSIDDVKYFSGGEREKTILVDI